MPRASPGSPRSRRRRSRSSSATGSCSCRSSTSKAWPRSRIPTTTRASAWSSAATRSWPRKRRRKREALLEATEQQLSEIQQRVEQGTLSGQAEIGLAVGAVWNRWRVKKHFELQITDTRFSFRRRQRQIEQEAALDGIYVLRTSVSAETLAAPEVVRSYKQLKEVERAFRSLKGPLELRPIHHRLEDRVRAHVFLCTLAYYLEWHLRQTWAELQLHRPITDAGPRPRRQGQPLAPRRPQGPHQAHRQ